jgi:hypothetical protein
VENKRRLMSLPEDSCLLAFKSQFSLEFCAQLDAAQASFALSNGSTR